MVCAFAVGMIVLLLNLLNWVKNDAWAGSICDVSLWLEVSGEKFCKNVYTGWSTIDDLYVWGIFNDWLWIISIVLSFVLFLVLWLPLLVINLVRNGAMNSTSISVFVRQALVEVLYLTPFWLAFVYLPTPFNILAPCLLIIKQKSPGGTDLYELQVLAKQAVMILARLGTDEDRENVERIKRTFILGNEPVHDADEKAASAKLLMDTVFHATSGLSIGTMICWFLLS